MFGLYFSLTKYALSLSLFLVVHSFVCRELAERKSQFAQEISAALMQVEDYKKASEEAASRADEAEQYQKMVQVNSTDYLNAFKIPAYFSFDITKSRSRS